MYDLKTILLAKRFRRNLDITHLTIADIAMLEIIKNKTSGNPVRDATIENGIAYFDRVAASQPLVSLKLNIPVTQTGSGTPSPDNIRDFISFSGVNIGQTSGYGEYFKGLLNGTYGFVDLGSLTWYHPNDSNRFIATISNIKLGMNGLCSSYPLTSTKGIDKTLYMFDGYYGGRRIAIFDSDYTNSATFKTAMSGVYLIYELAPPVTPTITPEQFATLCQAFGITDNTYQITFGQTVYSAILDVLNGKLIITHEIGDLSDLSWQYRDTYEIFYSGVNRNVKIGTPNCACSGYLFNPDAISTSVSSISRELNDKEITTFENENNQGRFAIKDTNYTDVASFREAITGMKLVYELAEPIEIQLTPTQITTLIGENVIFADVADVTECKYTRK